MKNYFANIIVNWLTMFTMNLSSSEEIKNFEIEYKNNQLQLNNSFDKSKILLSVYNK